MISDLCFSGVGIPLQIMSCATFFAYHNRFCKNLVEFFYHCHTGGVGPVPQGVVDNTRNCVIYDFTNHDLVLLPETICIWNYYMLANG